VSGPQIIVCLKVVPRPEEVRIDPETLRLNRDVRSMVNPADLHAVEVALRLRDQHGGRVRVLSMGPPFVEEHLRLVLAMGADEAYLLSDRAFGGADTLATSYTLAAAIRRLGPTDLVVCGEESSDGATAQVPPGIAEWLGFAQVTYVTEAALTDGASRLWARRTLPGGYEVLSTSLPAVLSVRSRSTWPRFLDMQRRDWAAGAAVTVWGAADLDADPDAIGMAGSPTVVAGTRETAQRDRRRERLTGTPTQQARALVDRLLPVVMGHLRSLPGQTGPPATPPETFPGGTPGETLGATPGATPPGGPAATTAHRLPRAARAPR
jgi:electron transfer flavoprotein beta subunit